MATTPLVDDGSKAKKADKKSKKKEKKENLEELKKELEIVRKDTEFSDLVVNSCHFNMVVLFL